MNITPTSLVPEKGALIRRTLLDALGQHHARYAFVVAPRPTISVAGVLMVPLLVRLMNGRLTVWLYDEIERVEDPVEAIGAIDEDAAPGQ